MTNITNAELTEMKERAKKATAGPWVTYYESLVKSKEGDKVVADTWQVVNGEYDARFIAHAREDVPRLVAEVERLREALRDIIQNSESPRTVSDLAEEALTGE